VVQLDYRFLDHGFSPPDGQLFLTRKNTQFYGGDLFFSPVSICLFPLARFPPGVFLSRKAFRVPAVQLAIGLASIRRSSSFSLSKALATVLLESPRPLPFLPLFGWRNDAPRRMHFSLQGGKLLSARSPKGPSFTLSLPRGRDRCLLFTAGSELRVSPKSPDSIFRCSTSLPFRDCRRTQRKSSFVSPCELKTPLFCTPPSQTLRWRSFALRAQGFSPRPGRIFLGHEAASFSIRVEGF